MSVTLRQYPHGMLPLKKIFCIGLFAASGASYAAQVDMKDEQALSNDSDVICRYESTSRGVLNGERLAFCLKNHERWIAEVVGFNRENQEDFYTKASYPFCYDRSTKRGVTNAGLLYVCLKSEVEAHKDVLYYLDTLGREKVIPIVRSELATYGSWAMVRFKIRNELGPPP